MPSETIRETLLEARTALRRKADDESTPLRDARILREAALLAELHSAALDVRGSGGTAACALHGIAGPRDFATMALLLAEQHDRTASLPGQEPKIVEGVTGRAACWRLLADEFPRPTDEGVSSTVLWAYMARVNLGLISLISAAPGPQQMMFIREVNMLATENLQLSLLREGTEEELSAEDAAIEASNALHSGAETTEIASDDGESSQETASQEPARPSLIVVASG
jgi:hypothetical protein